MTEVPVIWAKTKDAIARTNPQRKEASTSPISRYLDESRHEQELQGLRRFPHAVAASANVKNNGDWLSTTILEVPVLLVRGDDSLLRAFINVCRHRGVVLTPSECAGEGKKVFVCPYHSWSYDCRGKLRGRPHDSDFPHVPADSNGLVELPVASKCGLIWLVPSPGPFNWDEYFGPMAQQLEELGYNDSTQSPYHRKFEEPSNWKLIIDANLESYHFHYAHKNTIANLFHDNLVQHEQYGNHQRIVLPKRTAKEFTGPVETWNELGRHSNILYFFFPSTLLLWNGDHINSFRLSPITVKACETASWMLVTGVYAAQRKPEHWEKNWKLFWDALDEDYALASSMQAGLRSGANQILNFGTNEFQCDQFEQDVEKLVL